MRNFVVELIEELTLGQRGRSMRLSGAQRAQPFCGAGERAGERPAHEDERETGDEQRLHQRVNQ